MPLLLYAKNLAGSLAMVAVILFAWNQTLAGFNALVDECSTTTLVGIVRPPRFLIQARTPPAYASLEALARALEF
jgi:hypothetical protein